VGQLLWIGFEGTELPDAVAGRIAASEVGAAVLFRPRNMVSPEQVLALNAALHAAAPADAPLFIAVDQEGGRVQRLRAPATEWPPMLRLGELAERDETAAVDLARSVGKALGDELAAVGFDVDFAPVLDVHTNEANPIIGDRAFSTDPARVALLAGAFAEGLAAAGILGCGKHFPGHGDTHLDSHLALPRVSHPRERLDAVELLPFHRVRGLPMIMTAHVIFDAIEPGVPATFSAAAINILRAELGFDGLVVSDDLEMKAIADNYGIAESVERGLLAGCDTFLLCKDEALQQQAFEALLKAAEKSTAVRARVVEAEARVRVLKTRHFSPSRPAPTLESMRAVLGAHTDLAARLRA
jgi:beta-N-acetylhexosaminidase